MTRIDWLMVRRIAGSVTLTIAVFLGITILVESANLNRFESLAASGGVMLGVTGIVAAALRFILDAFAPILLIGAIIGLVALQMRGELTVIKSTGRSVWRLLAAPMLVVMAVGLVTALFVNTASVQLNRSIAPASAEPDASGGPAIWLDQRAGDLHYLFEARFVHPGGAEFDRVTVFMLDLPRDRLEAETARLVGREWVLTGVTRFTSNSVPEAITEFRLHAAVTPADVSARMSRVRDQTVFELGASLAAGLTDPALRSATLTRFMKLLALPLSMAGSLVIAFAFTAGYRRTNKYGASVLYGIVLGFVVYVLTELAGRAGDAGLIAPALAAFGPPLVAVIAGMTVLLYKEDGRT